MLRLSLWLKQFEFGSLRDQRNDANNYLVPLSFEVGDLMMMWIPTPESILQNSLTIISDRMGS